MEQYKTDAEIYAVLEREIIDLTIRPGSPLSENPLCARFGAPRTLIRMVLHSSYILPMSDILRELYLHAQHNIS